MRIPVSFRMSSIFLALLGGIFVLVIVRGVPITPAFISETIMRAMMLIAGVVGIMSDGKREKMNLCMLLGALAFIAGIVDIFVKSSVEQLPFFDLFVPLFAVLYIAKANKEKKI